ncbi:hypothetical protein H5410_058021 [Solanum commersonii]|uniref:DUF4283 domain-containing protein n=1 Tax=Solanum commersonii TaxID=4109 RepID=A0A9J5WRM4_SOLCO|nr:hypothetical protein H5410_058021 [Solanum commersonii]
MAMMAVGQPSPLEVGPPLHILSNTGQTSTTSFANTIKPNKPTHKPIPMKQVTYLHGEPRVIWDEDEVDQMIANEDLQYAVIGKFSYGWSVIHELRRLIPKQCGLQGEVNIGLLANRYVLIRATEMEDYVTLLSKPQFYISHQHWTYHMRILKWDPLFNPEEETSIVIAWISFPSLPPNFYGKEAIFLLAAAVGKPLQVDLATKNKTRPSCAKVKVEGHNEKECFILHPELNSKEEQDEEKNKDNTNEDIIENIKAGQTDNQEDGLGEEELKSVEPRLGGETEGVKSFSDEQTPATSSEREKAQNSEQHQSLQIKGDKSNNIQERHIEISTVDNHKERERTPELFQSPSELDSYKRRLGMQNAKVNQSAKIWIFWSDKCEEENYKDTLKQLTIKFKLRGTSDRFMVTTIYARCSALERQELWEDLKDIAYNSHIPWIVRGDFNVILDESKKLGGLPITQNEITDFAQCVSTCALTEIKFTGSSYTW